MFGTELYNKYFKIKATGVVGNIVDVLDVSDEDSYKFIYQLKDVQTEQLFEVSHESELIALCPAEEALYAKRQV